MAHWKETVYNLVVVGAGINGLSALYHAVRQNAGPCALVEQFDLGNEKGSSHGYTRVTRSVYVDEDYVRLMQVAHHEAWPELERTLGRTLIHRCEGCFYGFSEGKYSDYAEAVKRVGVDVLEVSPEAARSRYPQFTFKGASAVLIDRTGGLIAARDTIAGLSDYLRRRCLIRERTRVEEIDLTSDPICLRTTAGDLRAERVIVTAGPWVGRLLPATAGRVRVARQTVGYVELEGDAANYTPGRFPVWGCLGEQAAIVYYGLPQFGRPGIKVARHIVSGPDDDPDNLPDSPDLDAIKDLRRFLADHFAPSVRRIVDTEFCHYTNTGNEDFILDQHPENDRIVIGAGFSGHGFKFGPVTGRILADLALTGRCDLPEFAAARERFRLRPHPGSGQPF